MPPSTKKKKKLYYHGCISYYIDLGLCMSVYNSVSRVTSLHKTLHKSWCSYVCLQGVLVIVLALLSSPVLHLVWYVTIYTSALYYSCYLLQLFYYRTLINPYVHDKRYALLTSFLIVKLVSLSTSVVLRLCFPCA